LENIRRLAGHVVLVTGAGQGIGQDVAIRMAEEGARLILTDINAVSGQGIADRLGATFLHQDVSSEAGWREVIATVERDHGRLHVLINNAGIEGDPNAAKDPERAPIEDWNRIFEVNSTGVFLACKHAIPLMAKSGGGSIVNFSSVASLVPTPFIAAYGAAKAAVEHLTRSVALHCARAGYRIRCNSIHPGQVRTPMLQILFDRMSAQAGVSSEEFAQRFLANIPLGAFQEPRDIANAVLFLSSDEARCITGQALAVDGGFTLAN
jgi:3(or 17)beta-hydroxysteroid dehydrogenase